MRLVTGEDIVGDATYIETEEENAHFLIHKPLKIVYMMDGQGHLAVSLTEWIISNLVRNPTYKIYTSDVLVDQLASDELIESYGKVLVVHSKMDAQAEEMEDEEDIVEEEVFEKDTKRGKRTLH